MKNKFIYGFVAIILCSSSFGHEILKQYTDSYGSTDHTVKCDSGKITNVTQIKDSYASSGSSGVKNSQSLNNAIRYACETKKSSNKSTGKIKNESMVFKKRTGVDGIEEALSKKLTFLSMKAMAAMGNTDFWLTKGGNVNLSKYYAPYKVIVDEYGNYSEHIPNKEKKLTNGTFKKVILFEGYYKVKDNSGSIYYVRESDLVL